MIIIKNRFIKHHMTIRKLSIYLYTGASVLIICLFIYALGNLGQDTLKRQQESLTNALNRDIAQCYAVEGIYPPNLAYLQQHYGLTYDTALFYVDYQPIGSNLYPDITIINIKDSQK